MYDYCDYCAVCVCAAYVGNLRQIGRFMMRTRALTHLRSMKMKRSLAKNSEMRFSNEEKKKKKRDEKRIGSTKRKQELHHHYITVRSRSQCSRR